MAAARPGRTSSQGFLPTPTHKKPWHNGEPPPSFASHGLVVTIIVSSWKIACGLKDGGTRQRRIRDSSSTTVREEPSSTAASPRSSTGQSDRSTPGPTLARLDPNGPLKPRQPCCNKPATPPSLVWPSHHRHLQEAPETKASRPA
jgi:hypothetical protein